MILSARLACPRFRFWSVVRLVLIILVTAGSATDATAAQDQDSAASGVAAGLLKDIESHQRELLDQVESFLAQTDLADLHAEPTMLSEWSSALTLSQKQAVLEMYLDKLTRHDSRLAQLPDGVAKQLLVLPWAYAFADTIGLPHRSIRPRVEFRQIHGTNRHSHFPVVKGAAVGERFPHDRSLSTNELEDYIDQLQADEFDFLVLYEISVSTVRRTLNRTYRERYTPFSTQPTVADDSQRTVDNVRVDVEIVLGEYDVKNIEVTKDVGVNFFLVDLDHVYYLDANQMTICTGDFGRVGAHRR